MSLLQVLADFIVSGKQEWGEALGMNCEDWMWCAEREGQAVGGGRRLVNVALNGRGVESDARRLVAPLEADATAYRTRRGRVTSGSNFIGCCESGGVAHRLVAAPVEGRTARLDARRFVALAWRGAHRDNALLLIAALVEGRRHWRGSAPIGSGSTGGEERQDCHAHLKLLATDYCTRR